MTAFTRTNSGLTNLGLFHSVELVVFTEGGNNTLSVADILSGAENIASEDTKFWKLVLDRNGLRKTYTLKAIGSKASVLNIAARIEAGEVSNVAAAMDRDLDDFLGGQPQSPLILYTHGYSWEADVFTKELTKEQIASFLFMDPLNDAVDREVEAAYRTFEKFGSKIAKAELIFRAQGIAWISEARGERFFRPENRGLLDLANLKSSINEKKAHVQRPAVCPLAPGTPVDPYKLNCGKLIRALSSAVMKYIGKKYGNISSLQNDVVSAVMLDRFGGSERHVRSSYYASCVAGLDAAL